MEANGWTWARCPACGQRGTVVDAALGERRLPGWACMATARACKAFGRLHPVRGKLAPAALHQRVHPAAVMHAAERAWLHHLRANGTGPTLGDLPRVSAALAVLRGAMEGT